MVNFPRTKQTGRYALEVGQLLTFPSPILAPILGATLYMLINQSINSFIYSIRQTLAARATVIRTRDVTIPVILEPDPEPESLLCQKLVKIRIRIRWLSRTGLKPDLEPESSKFQNKHQSGSGAETGPGIVTSQVIRTPVLLYRRHSVRKKCESNAKLFSCDLLAIGCTLRVAATIWCCDARFISISFPHFTNPTSLHLQTSACIWNYN